MKVPPNNTGTQVSAHGSWTARGSPKRAGRHVISNLGSRGEETYHLEYLGLPSSAGGQIYDRVDGGGGITPKALGEGERSK